MYKLPIFVLLASVLILSACSSGGSDSPSDSNAHSQSWFATHSVTASAEPGYADCKGCHGNDLLGSGNAVSCYSCHSYNTEPPFTFHPPTWSDPYLNHRGYAAVNGFDSCAACHGQGLTGQPPAPSCFSDNFNGQSCHADGPGQAPHPLDGTYLSGSVHGPDAKADLTACQSCHGQPGGPGSNPRFNVGISSVSGTGCESASCHGEDYAHPVNWAGPNTTFHYSAGNLQNSCTLCHGVDLDGVGGVGVSCLECHAETANFTLDCSACHALPPLGSPDDAAPTPVNHGNVAGIGSHDVCVACHGMKETTAGGSFSAASNYSLFDKSTETNGDHWNGKIEMNSGTQYNAANFGCDAANCHSNNPAHQLSDSGLPVALKDFGAGSAPHPTDFTFLNPANHGPAAKGLTAAFPNGLLDCQECHAEAGGPGSNPRFNVGISAINSTGCEGCHNDRTAHPTNGSGDSQTWYNNTSYFHSDVQDFGMCTLCHGVTLAGGIGPACTSCHSVDPVANSSGCVSCHNLPPNGGSIAGNVRPNRAGRHGDPSIHSVVPCSACHSGLDYQTNSHFDFEAPADVVIGADYGAPSGAGTYNSATGYCNNITCHGGNGSSEGPWYQ